MARTHDPRKPRSRRLRLVPREPSFTEPLPAVVPLLRPDQRATAAQDALLTAIARRARLGDRAARALLWRAFWPRLEPAVRRCGRMAWHQEWARRNERPWELEDLQQEAWLVFAEMTEQWDGEGSCIPYLTAYFPWRLRNALRRLGPVRRNVSLVAAAGMVGECQQLSDAEREALLAGIGALLSTKDEAVLRLRAEGNSLGATARCLGVSRRTVSRRWRRICRTSLALLSAELKPTSRTIHEGWLKR